MSSYKGTKSVEEGALTPVHLALGHLKGVTGEFWENEAVSQWG